MADDADQGDVGTAGAPIPVVWCVDIEPEERQVELPDPSWRGTDETVEHLERWRPMVEAATGAPVHFSWFWRADPQIEQVYGDAEWGLVRYRDVLHSTLLEGDAHGIHPHYWRRADPSSAWTEDFRDRAWMDHCARVAFKAFEQQVGSPPLLNRGGTRLTSSRTTRLLGRLGIRVDLTVEPGMPPEPDYRAVACQPYQPAALNFRRSRRLPLGPRGLTMLPLTTRYPADGRRPQVVFSPWSDPSVVTAAVDALLADGQRYLAFAIRTDAPVAGLWPNIKQLLDHLEQHPMARRFRFTTPIEALDLLASPERVGAT